MTDIKNMYYRLKANLRKSKFHLDISKTKRIILKQSIEKSKTNITHLNRKIGNVKTIQ